MDSIQRICDMLTICWDKKCFVFKIFIVIIKNRDLAFAQIWIHFSVEWQHHIAQSRENLSHRSSIAGRIGKNWFSTSKHDERAVQRKFWYICDGSNLGRIHANHVITVQKYEFVFWGIFLGQISELKFIYYCSGFENNSVKLDPLCVCKSFCCCLIFKNVVFTIF